MYLPTDQGRRIIPQSEYILTITNYINIRKISLCI